MNNYHNYNIEHQNAIAQDFINWAAKFTLSKIIVALTNPSDRKRMECICDGASGLIDCINPPKTIEGKILSLGTNAYNIFKYL